MMQDEYFFCHPKRMLFQIQAESMRNHVIHSNVGILINIGIQDSMTEYGCSGFYLNDSFTMDYSSITSFS